MVQNSVGGDTPFSFEDQPKAKQTVIDSRISICNDCPYKEDDRCNQCGCTISIISQVEFARCPIDKWNVINANNL
jgi:hypothetical protein